MSLAGKGVVVTGASRGIGRAIARAFASAGAKLAICSVDDARLRDAERELAPVVAERCDVSNGSDVTRFIAAIQSKLGTPDVIVHNAGVVDRVRLDEMSEASWDRTFDVNVKSTFLLTRAFLPKMRARKSGRIIFIGSISATLGTAKLTAYCASKHAIVGLTRALAEEVRDDGIQVNAINPGSVDTDMLKGSGFDPDVTPDEIANVSLYLADAAPATMTGACIDVFG
jgi:3-oxoacyl-[acyl-carrier protein] reductase